MFKPDDVRELLSVLHSQGYRLRKIGADSLEVEDFGPKLNLGEEQPVQRQEEPPAEEDSPLYDHVGGRPKWLRSVKPKSEKSPWADDVGRES